MAFLFTAIGCCWCWWGCAEAVVVVVRVPLVWTVVVEVGSGVEAAVNVDGIVAPSVTAVVVGAGGSVSTGARGGSGDLYGCCKADVTVCPGLEWMSMSALSLQALL